jgi:hypothetical protein
MTPLTLQQIDGLHNAPRKLVRQLAHTAALALRRADELAAQVRQKDEELAAMQMAKSPALVLLHHDGWVEIVSESRLPIKCVLVPDLPNYEDALEWSTRGLAKYYRDLASRFFFTLDTGFVRRVTEDDVSRCREWEETWKLVKSICEDLKKLPREEVAHA